jgi:hypothetical protein
VVQGSQVCAWPWRVFTLMHHCELWVLWIPLWMFTESCADGETGLGIADSSGGAAVGSGASAGAGNSVPLGLAEYCDVTCEAIADLNCEREASREVCEVHCLRIPLPTSGGPCYLEEMALARCQYDNAATAFECDAAGKSSAATNVCNEEMLQAVISCGGL